MGFALTTARKDLRRRATDPWSLLMWLGIPLLIGGLITLATGGSGGPRPKARLLVANLDDHALSGFLVGALGSEQMGEVIGTEEVEEEEGRARLAEGDGSALLIIPEGFADAVLLEEPAELLLLTNPSQNILPKIVEETLSVLVDAVFYLHRLLGDQIRTIAAGPDSGNFFPDPQIASFSTEINQAVKRVEKYLMPPVITFQSTLENPEDEEEEEPLPFGAYFFPGVILMALFFTSQGVSDDLWEEREQGTLRRVVTTPRDVSRFLAGKVLAGLVIVAAVCLAALILGMGYFGMPLSDLPLALAWSTAAGGVLLLLCYWIVTLASSRRGAAIIVNTATFPLLMVGGSFFPFEAMPGWMASVGRSTPNGWALQRLKEILLQQEDPTLLLLGFAGMVAMGAVLFVLLGRRIRGGFAQS